MRQESQSTGDTNEQSWQTENKNRKEWRGGKKRSANKMKGQQIELESGQTRRCPSMRTLLPCVLNSFIPHYSSTKRIHAFWQFEDLNSQGKGQVWLTFCLLVVLLSVLTSLSGSVWLITFLVAELYNIPHNCIVFFLSNVSDSCRCTFMKP